jgi:hypothetical protein
MRFASVPSRAAAALGVSLLAPHCSAHARRVASESAASSSDARPGNAASRARHRASHYDAATNTTTISDDAADVITASFGVQQSVRPAWSWSAHDEDAPNGADDGVASSTTAVAGAPPPPLPLTPYTVTEGTVTGGADAAVTDDAGHGDALARESQRGVPPLVSPEENFVLEFQRHYYRNRTQVGAYIGSTVAGEQGEGRLGGSGAGALSLRHRREIERVPPWQPPYEAAETSFRRLPLSARLPSERELRFIYPMRTELPIQWHTADCADFNMVDLDEDAAPIKYGVLYPRNYDARKPHPTMVWLSDHRGLECDFEDSCAHLFERSQHYEGWYERGWVIYAPVISMRHAQLHPQEGVVARFCDWLTANRRVEHGKVHLAGKGYGAFTALRTVLEMRRIAISCTALCGRLAGPFRPLDRPQEKAHNIDGTHVLIYVPGDMRKTEYVYKFKGFCDLARVKPPVRAVHFADVRDHQLYYAVNPIEFWNYQEFFRTHCHHQPVAVS